MLSFPISFTVLAFLACTGVVAFSSSASPKKVAVIGTTGNLGRTVIQLLSKQGISTRCLLRHDISSLSPPPSIEKAQSSQEVAAYLQSLPGVEMVQGDINDPSSVATLLQDTSACLALHGPVAPKPFFRSLLLPWILFPESSPTHAKQLNYCGIQNILQVMQASGSTCKHLVRITGKGEDPWSIFSILINALGGLAKGWNYEGEQLIRNAAARDDSLRYTIIRPGILKGELADAGSTTPCLGVKGNGDDLPVTTVTYEQIANLVDTSLRKGNLQRSTLTAMNVASNNNNDVTVDAVQPDSRDFPSSLIDEHKRAARVGGLSMMLVMMLLVKAVTSLLGKLIF